MQINGTLQSIIEFSNFFDHQLFVHCSNDKNFYCVKSGSYKKIKFPQHLQKLLDDKFTFSKVINSGNEKSVLHIFRLGDGHTLFLNDPGTGTVLNGFVLSLITLSSNVCDLSAKNDSSGSDINSVLLDKLVADFDKERKVSAVKDKRQKEEIIILEEQAKEAYTQLDQMQKTLKDKDAEISELKKRLSALAESYKELEKHYQDAASTADFNIGAEIKKKNETLRLNNKKLVEMVRKNSLTIAELQTEVEMCIKDASENTDIPPEKLNEMLSSVKEIFSSENALAANKA